MTTLLANTTAPPVLEGFNPTMLLVLNLAGTFAFGLSGGMAGVRARLDIFGVSVLAVVVAMAGGITRDLLIGIPPETIRDWRFLGAASGAAVLVMVAHTLLERLHRPILVLDAGGLALFCVTGAATAFHHEMDVPTAIIMGALTGVGGGVVRDVLIGDVPVVLRSGLYAIPALAGAAVVAIAYSNGGRSVAYPIAGAALCLFVRLAALRYDLHVTLPSRRRPSPPDR